MTEPLPLGPILTRAMERVDRRLALTGPGETAYRATIEDEDGRLWRITVESVERQPVPGVYG